MKRCSTFERLANPLAQAREVGAALRLMRLRHALTPTEHHIAQAKQASAHHACLAAALGGAPKVAQQLRPAHLLALDPQVRVGIVAITAHYAVRSLLTLWKSTRPGPLRRPRSVHGGRGAQTWT